MPAKTLKKRKNQETKNYVVNLPVNDMGGAYALTASEIETIKHKAKEHGQSIRMFITGHLKKTLLKG